MKPDPSVLRETGRVAVGTLVACVLMLVIYAIVGRFSMPVVYGALYTGALTVINFFVMGLTVQGIANRAAEKQRDELEMQQFTKQMESRMQATRTGRMIVLLGLIIVGIRVLKFDALATILPIAFPGVVIRVLQIIDIKKEAKGSGAK